MAKFEIFSEPIQRILKFKKYNYVNVNQHGRLSNKTDFPSRLEKKKGARSNGRHQSRVYNILAKL